MPPAFFANATEFRAWLAQHHASAAELHVGFYKKTSGKSGLTYPEAVDEALCFGWIDGVVKSLGAESYQHRFTPRRPHSIWSNRNVRHVARLTAAGKMHAAGLAAFAARKPHKTGVYLFEQKERPARAEKFSPNFTRLFRSHSPAWQHWEKSPPGYRRQHIAWVIAAKQPETRLRRLQKLIAHHANAQKVHQPNRPRP